MGSSPLELTSNPSADPILQRWQPTLHTPAQTRRYLVVLTVTMLALSFITILFEEQPINGNEFLHSTLELVGSLFAFLIGFSLIARFYLFGNRFQLFIGLAFFVNGIEDLIHGGLSLLVAILGDASPPVIPRKLVPGTFAAGRLLMGLLVMLAPIAPKWFKRSSDYRHETLLFTSWVLTLSLLTTLAIFYLPLDRFIYPERFVSRPADFISALALLAAFGVLLEDYIRRREALTWWICLAMGVTMLGQAFMGFSRHFFDLQFNISHLYKILGYILPLVGLMLYQLKLLQARREVELSLQSSREVLADFLDNAHDLILSTDPDGKLLFVNKLWKETLGYSYNEIAGMSIYQIVHPDERMKCERIFKTVLAGIPHNYIETKFVTRDGRVINVLGSANCRFEDGRPVATRSIFRNVTDSRIAEDALSKTQEELDSFFSLSLDLMAIIDFDGSFKRFNQAWLDTLGYSQKELFSHPFTHYVHAEDRARTEAELAAARGGRSLSRFENRYVAVDGAVRWLMWTARPQPEKRLLYMVARDITDRRRAEERLRAGEARLRAIHDHVFDGIITVDASGIVQTFNPAAERLFGWSAREAFGMDIRTLLPDGVQGRRFAVLRRWIARQGAFSQPIETAGKNRSGRSLDLELSVSPIDFGTGMLYTGVVRDISGRKKAEEALKTARDSAESANRAKSEFLANMSHELRTPLNSVIGFANVLLKNRRKALESQELTYLERIAANGRHLLDLINDVLDLSKIEAGRLELQISPVDMKALVLDVAEQMKGQVAESDIELAVQLPQNVSAVHTDAVRMRQVLINLVGNAIKFTERGRVTIALEADDAGAPKVLSVSDTGVGIPAHQLQAIFEPFQQADGSSSRRYGGTGLGLSITRSLLERMGFDIQVFSSPGAGSTFRIKFV